MKKFLIFMIISAFMVGCTTPTETDKELEEFKTYLNVVENDVEQLYDGFYRNYKEVRVIYSYTNKGNKTITGVKLFFYVKGEDGLPYYSKNIEIDNLAPTSGVIKQEITIDTKGRKKISLGYDLKR